MKFLTISSLRLLFALAIVALIQVSAVAADSDEVFGPPNLFKTLPTPFGLSEDSSDNAQPLSLGCGPRTLASRLLPPRVYLPGRLVIGSTAQFIIKGRPGYWVALAMADRNKGAKPIRGQLVHLGADRKVVALGKIPPSGVLTLIIDTPIEGDLIGQPLYFEAALWSQSDFSDMELAAPVASEQTATRRGERDNGVVVAGEPSHKRGIRIVPDGTVSLPSMQNASSMDSGRP